MKIDQWLQRRRRRHEWYGAKPRRSNRAGRFELLEPRLVLAGHLGNTAISDHAMQAILDGLDGFATFGGNLSEHGEFAEPLALITDPNGADYTIGGLLNIGDLLDESLAAPVRSYLESLPVADRTTDALVDFLATLPEVTTVEGGLTGVPTQEVRFELQMHDEALISSCAIDFGSQGDGLGLAATSPIDCAGFALMADFTFVFGITLDSELNTEQAFFVRDAELNVSATMHNQTDLEFGLRVGFLDTLARATLLEEEGIFYVTMKNPVPDSFGNVTLSELNGYAVDELSEIRVISNTLEATLEVPASLGSWIASGTPTITVSGAAVGSEPNIAASADFAELLQFNNVDAEMLIGGLEQIAGFLSGFTHSSLLQVAIPFAAGATLGSTFNLGVALGTKLTVLRDSSGLPTFDSVESFRLVVEGMTQGAVTVDYDAATNQLDYAISIDNFASQQTEALLEFGAEVSNLTNLATGAVASLTANAMLSFEYAIALDNPDLDDSERISVRNQDIAVENDETHLGATRAGNARYGMVGIDFADVAYSGTSSYHATVAKDESVTIAGLFAGLSDPASLLGSPIAFAGSTTLELIDVAVQDALFAIPAGAAITASVADFAQSTVVSVVETGVGALSNFANVTQEFIVDSVTAGLMGAAKWYVPDMDPYGIRSIAVGISDFVETRLAETVASAVGAGFEAFESATGASARLQDVAEVFAVYITDIVTDTVMGANLAATVAADELNATIDLGLTVVTGTVQQAVETGLDVAELAAATGEAFITAVGDFAGSFIPVEAEVSSNFDLEFQFDAGDPDRPLAYLLTTSSLTAQVYVEEVSLTGDGSLGVLGLVFDDGSLVIAADRLAPDPASPATLTVGLADSAPDGRVPIEEVEQAPLETAATGQLDFNYRVTVEPSTAPELNRFHFQIHDLNNPAGSTEFPTDPPDFQTLSNAITLDSTLNGLPDALDGLLGDLEAAADLEVFGLRFPLIGDKLDGVANVIRLLRDRINSYLDLLSTFDSSSIEGAIEDAIGDLVGSAGDRVDVEIPNDDEVLFTISFAGAPLNESLDVSTDLGLPALGASFDAELSVVGSYAMVFTIGVSRADGVYIDTSRAKEVAVILNVDVAGALEGRLGFIEVAVAAAPGGSCLTRSGVPTAFHAEFGVGFADPDGDGKLKISELGGGNLIDMANTGLEGCADIALDASASTDILWLPSLETGINIEWDFDGTDLDGDVPRVTYDGVRLKLGSFLSNSIGPILDGIDNFFDGVCPVVDTITAPLPIISDFTNDPDSIIEFATFIFPELEPLEFVAELADSICTLGQAIDVARSGPDTSIEFGDLRFGFDHDNDSSTEPAFDPRQPNLAFDLNQQVDLEPGDSPWQQVLAEVPELQTQTANVESSEGELSFPILENPIGLFEYLLGFGSVDIFAYRFPTLDASIPFNVSFPILCTPLGCLNAIIVGDLSIQFNLAVGYDTKGFERYQESGNIADLFYGFYVSDRSEPDGSGQDISELEISGTLVAGPSFGIPNVLEAYVAGGVEASLGVDLLDLDGDGKTHGDEFVSSIGCMRLLGEIGVRLEAGLVVGPFTARFPFEYERIGGFNEIVQCSLPGITPPSLTDENLAELENGQLTLLMGPRAGERSIEKNETDEGFTVVFLSGECDGVPDGTIIVQAFDGKEEFCASDVDTIFADGADGADRVTIEALVDRPATILGGDGDDVVVGGSQSDSIEGGPGNDILLGADGLDTVLGQDDDDVIDGGADRGVLNGGRGHDSIIGGSDADVITGGAGHDTISGGDENSPGDTIDGESGDDVIYGGFGDDVITTGDGDNIAFGDGGNDSITGGSDIDRIYGGADQDTIRGGAGDDVLIGEDGDDDLFGDEDNDLIDGGLGIDEIAGNEGDDELFGGGDNDTIDGNIGADYVEGGTGDDTSLSGGDGPDTIYGGEGGDAIFGNTGDDQLFGDAGEDEIHGHKGSDILEGGTEHDELFGGDAGDVVRGGDGPDNIEGGLGNDELFGDANTDTIYGNNGLDQSGSDCDPVAEPDRDSIYGGSSGDIISGDCDDDSIFGEAGPDNIHGNDGVDVIDGGTDNDLLFGDGGNDNLQGGDENDLIDGGDQDDLARGGSGEDRVFGQNGMDSLYGDAGDDVIDGGPQSDLIDGGADDDHLIGQGDADEIYGNTGGDAIEGNEGDDVIRGNIGEDLIYGDGGNDDIAGGPDNDTTRGGDENDTIRGGPGDDLVLGHSGNDSLFGDTGDDVLYGYLGADHIFGGPNNDRAYGQEGDDVLAGEEGDDILEAGPDNDTAFGGIGRDALYGDSGVDNLSGGDEDDFIMAGDGVGDVLNGDDGNDHIIGSDDGDEDPNFADTLFFGDVIDGGQGDDTVESLGGADVIQVGQGSDAVSDGTHIDQITGGVALPGPTATLDLSTGPEVGGHWAELSGSASEGGLTQVGGFEQAIFATAEGVYVAWVDWRNGNAEVYVAFHSNDSGDWVEINGSAHAGGVSDDADQSRRPTIVEITNFNNVTMASETELLVAWTRIQSSGMRTIEVARRDGNTWTRLANPGQIGKPDNARLLPYSDESALLAWSDESSGTGRVVVAQYIFEPNCFRDFQPGPVGGYSVTTATRGSADVSQFDIAAVESRAAVIASFGSAGDHDIEVTQSGAGSLLQENNLCPPKNGTIDVETLGTFALLGTFTDGDAIEPTVAMRLVHKETLGQNEVRISTDTYVAWHEITDRSDQVIGKVRRQELNGMLAQWEDLESVFTNCTGPFGHSISDTIGYAAKPDMAASNVIESLGVQYTMFLAWTDDGVHGSDRGDRSGRSSVFVMSLEGDSRTLIERLPHDASGIGISPTGGSVNSVSIASLRIELEEVDSVTPYVAWTDHRADRGTNVAAGPGPTQVMLRHDLDLPEYAVSIRSTGGSTAVTEGGTTDSFSIVLMAEPASDVLITLTPNSQVTVSPTTVLFTLMNWSTPRVVEVSAIDDLAIELCGIGSFGCPESGKIVYAVSSSDPNYNQIAVTPTTVSLRDNDFWIVEARPMTRQVGRKQVVAGFVVCMSGVTDYVAAGSVGNYRLTQTAKRGGKNVPLLSVTYDTATKCARLTAAAALKPNSPYDLAVSNTSIAGASFTTQIIFGAKLTYVDDSNDTVTLNLTNGALSIISPRDAASGLPSGIRSLGVFPVAEGATLSGTVKRPKRGTSDETTTIAALTIPTGLSFTSTLKNPPFRIGPLAQTVIDQLLLASGGSLASVLV